MRTLFLLTWIACSPEDKNDGSGEKLDPDVASDTDTSPGTDDTAAPVSIEDTGEERTGPQFVPDAADGASVERVDPTRYLGLWYEIATTPSQQQTFCSGTTAEYSLIDDTTVGVTNRCFVGDLTGRLNEVDATARVLDETYARLMVDFGYGFEAPYTIIDLVQTPGESPYTYATVASSSGQYWILSRTPQMPLEMYTTLMQRIDERGGDASRLIETEQPVDADTDQ